MKAYIKYILLTIVLVLVLTTFAACDKDGTNADETYVPVEGVRVSNAVAYLSPDGETNTYQLEASVFPENATNRKLLYYVDPDSLDYFDVSADGLITAKKITDEGSVPIKIYSASHPDKYTIVSVVIENVEVKGISFPEEEIEVLYNSDPIDLDIKYEPYHAQDGRDVIYISQDTEVATVDNSGILTVNDVGITTIIARGTTLGGRTIEGRVRVKVVYDKGSYRLEVTDPAPRYEQIIGEDNAHLIPFNVIRLNPHSDPNPKIEWRVAGDRILSQNGKWQYNYKPDPESTPATFTVTVEITPKAEQTIILESLPITLYREFTGFDLIKNQPEGLKYEYGDIANFDPEMEDIERYEWYIKSQGEPGLGSHKATTLFSQNYGIYNMHMDEEGAFTLTVSGYADQDVEINRRSFDFHVIKYTSGDRVQILPQITNGQKIPESFDWYYHEYDSSVQSDDIRDKLVNIDGLYVGTSISDQPFNFEAETPGAYVLSSVPTLNGLPVTIIEDGQSKRMIEYTEPFTVWEKQNRPRVNYLIIDGVKVDEEDYRPMIKWGQLGGVNNFIIEVFSNNQIYLLDTLEKESDERGIIYRDYSVILPPEIATFSQDFSARVKKRGGEYCDSVSYTANTITSDNFSYLNEINFSINGYLTDMYEMGELINHISIYRPESLLKEQTETLSKYAIRVQTPIVYNYLSGNYPVYNQPEYESMILNNIHNIIFGAYNTYGIKEYVDLEFEYFDFDDSFEMILTLPLDTDNYIRQIGDGVKNYDFLINYSQTGREEYQDFNIQTKETINVSSSEQLYYVVSMGKQATPIEDSIAQEIYLEALNILNQILSPDMNEFEKTLAIYDYFAKNVEYDKPLYEYSRMFNQPEDLYLHAGYHLEGAILDKKALSFGISKAFNLLCWIEGMASYTAQGTFNNQSHYWNKVLVGHEWYNIDAARARIQRDFAIINHLFFLKSDIRFDDLGYETFGQYPQCYLDYEIDATVDGYNLISSKEDNSLYDLIQSYASELSQTMSFEIELDVGLFEDHINSRNFVLNQAQLALEENAATYKEIYQVDDCFFVLVIEPNHLQ